MVLGLFLDLISWIGSPQLKVQLFGLGLIQFHSVAISKCLIFCLIILIFTKPSFFFSYLVFSCLYIYIYIYIYIFFFLEGGKYKSGTKICICPYS